MFLSMLVIIISIILVLINIIGWILCIGCIDDMLNTWNQSINKSCLKEKESDYSKQDKSDINYNSEDNNT